MREGEGDRIRESQGEAYLRGALATKKLTKTPITRTLHPLIYCTYAYAVSGKERKGEGGRERERTGRRWHRERLLSSQFVSRPHGLDRRGRPSASFLG